MAEGKCVVSGAFLLDLLVFSAFVALYLFSLNIFCTCARVCFNLFGLLPSECPTPHHSKNNQSKRRQVQQQVEGNEGQQN